MLTLLLLLEGDVLTFLLEELLWETLFPLELLLFDLLATVRCVLVVELFIDLPLLDLP